MAKLAVVDTKGKKVSDIELNDSIFAIEPNTSAMHLVVVNYLAHQRQGTQSTLTRAEVSGGGKKQVELVRVQRELHNGHMVVSHLVLSHVLTDSQSTRR